MSKSYVLSKKVKIIKNKARGTYSVKRGHSSMDNWWDFADSRWRHERYCGDSYTSDIEVAAKVARDYIGSLH